MSLLHPIIKIFHTQNEYGRALAIRESYSKLGASVGLYFVESKFNVRNEVRYFNNENPRFHEIAEIIAKKIRWHSEVYVAFYENCEPFTDFAIYLADDPSVSPNRSAAINKKSVALSKSHLVKVSDKIRLTNCPKCSCYIRFDRMEKHLERVHSRKKATKRLKTKRLLIQKTNPRLSFSGNKRAISTDTHSEYPLTFGKPIRISFMPALSNRIISKACRICKEQVAMYNSEECYACNPK